MKEQPKEQPAIQYEKSIFLINAVMAVILGVVLKQSIEIIFDKNRMVIGDIFHMSALHFVLIMNLLVDWMSANIKNFLEKGLNFFIAFCVVVLLLIEGYGCLLALDCKSSIPVLILIIITALSVLYELYFFAVTSKVFYRIFLIVRLLLLMLLIIAYLSWHNTHDIGGVLSIIIVLIIVKSVRLFFLKREGENVN